MVGTIAAMRVTRMSFDMSKKCLCNVCKYLVNTEDIFTCHICSLVVCQNCVEHIGRWFHTKQLCQKCVTQTCLYHDLNYICSRNCELVFSFRFKLSI